MYSTIWKTKTKVSETAYASAFSVESRVPLFWREHCMECAMPLCYKTCDIYKRRIDGRCLRFENGIVPTRLMVEGCRLKVEGEEITFRRWAKLQSEFVGLSVVRDSWFVGQFWRTLERVTRGLSDVIHQYRLCQIEASLAERINACIARRHKGEVADGFLATIKNCEDKSLKLILEICGKKGVAFKYAFDLPPGWNEEMVDVSSLVNIGNRGIIRAYLEGDQIGKLIFQNFDFVKLAESKKSAAPAKKVKCVAWDLDNTLWEGVIGEVGADGVKMKPESVSLIKALDERGVVQTIASKNTREIAWPKLESEGLAEYFLYPAINWGRKSESMKTVAKSLNINIDTFALIDDSAFERNEVQTALPQVRVYDVIEVPRLLERDEFNLPITEASKRRRLSYKEEEKRNDIKSSWSGDYDSFLKSCGLKMTIFEPKNDADFKRCLELINRSNQYNISGRRYEAEELRSFVARPEVSQYAFKVKDNYGDYGIVGYATIVNSETEWRLLDFVMSCRVAQKKIERAFINWLVSKLPRKEMLVASIKKTDRNKPLQDEFKGMPFEIEDGEIMNLRYKADGKVNDGIVEVDEI